MSDDKERLEEIVRRIRGGDTELKEAVTEEIGKVIGPAPSHTSAPEPGKDWYLIRVELTSGLGQEFDPPLGRDFLISPQHTFRQLAEVINAAFTRWDLGHLYVFRFADGTMVGTPAEELPFKEAARTKIGKRTRGRPSSTNSTLATRGSIAAPSWRWKWRPRTSTAFVRRGLWPSGAGAQSRISTAARRRTGRSRGLPFQ